MSFIMTIIGRLAQAIGVMLVVAFLAFVLSNYVGDPIANMVGQETSTQDRERLREALGLNDPVPVRFARFVGNALVGDFGISYRLQRPVSELIAERLPATLELVAISALFALIFGLTLGVFTAINRDNAATDVLRSHAATTPALRRIAMAAQALGLIAALALGWSAITGTLRGVGLGAAAIAGLTILGLLASRSLSVHGMTIGGFAFIRGIVNALLARLVMTVSLIGVSLPTFVVGLLLIYIFAVERQILPSFGRGEVVDLGWWTTGLATTEGWKAIILPAITLGLYQLTIILRLVRAEMLEVLRTDYIKFARARGLPDRTIYFGHALKNTMLPVITITGLQIGSLVAFSIITETVFQWPGMGLLFIQGVRFADVPVMSAYLVLASFVFVTVNFIVDMLYLAVDPRLRTQRSAAAAGEA